MTYTNTMDDVLLHLYLDECENIMALCKFGTDQDILHAKRDYVRSAIGALLDDDLRWFKFYCMAYERLCELEVSAFN
jgi:hypothetical protein